MADAVTAEDVGSVPAGGSLLLNFELVFEKVKGPGCPDKGARHRAEGRLRALPKSSG